MAKSSGPVDIIYDGLTLRWITNGNKTYKATSGIMHGQKVELQTYADFGPVPNGLYSASTTDNGTAAIEEVGNMLALKYGGGYQKIPDEYKGRKVDFQNWGKHRLRLDAVHIEDRSAASRGGFYIHDSTKGFSHGCIETQGTFFSDLEAYMKSPAGKKHWLLRVQVKYAAGVSITNGGTGVGSKYPGAWTPQDESNYHAKKPPVDPRDDPFNEHHR